MAVLGSPWGRELILRGAEERLLVYLLFKIWYDAHVRASLIKVLWQFLITEKKYWFLPALLMFVLFGMLLVVSQMSGGQAFIYTLF